MLGSPLSSKSVVPVRPMSRADIEIINLQPTTFDLSDIGIDNVQSAKLELTRDLGEFQKKCTSWLAGPMPDDRYKQLLDRYSCIENKRRKLRAYTTLQFAQDTSNSEARAEKSEINDFDAAAAMQTHALEVWFRNLSKERQTHYLNLSGAHRRQLETWATWGTTTVEAEMRATELIAAGRATLDSAQVTWGESQELKDGLKLNNWQILTLAESHDYKITEDNLRHAADKVAPHIAARMSQLSNELGLRGLNSLETYYQLSHEVSPELFMAVDHAYDRICRSYDGVWPKKASHLNLEGRLDTSNYRLPIGGFSHALSYEESISLALDVLENIHPELKRIAQRLIMSGHIHSRDIPGKKRSPHCFAQHAGVDVDSFVYLNYPSDHSKISKQESQLLAFATIHETLHALHGIVARQDGQASALTYVPQLIITEAVTAFGEAMLAQHLLEQEIWDEPSFNWWHANSIHDSIIRPIGITRFERKCALLVNSAEGQCITPEQLNDAWSESLQQQLGKEFPLTPAAKFGWARIPHLLRSSPLNCFDYGIAKFIGLRWLSRFKNSETAAPRDFMNFLKLGGTLSPAELLEHTNLGSFNPASDFTRELVSSVEDIISQIQ